jgi:hypothetical protein
MAKNLLQEYYQTLTRETGQLHALPAYKTVRAGGADHIPTYVSTVTCGRIVVTGDPKPNKKAAEADAASKAYQRITTPQASTTISSPRTPLPLGSSRVLPIVVPPLSDQPVVAVPSVPPVGHIIRAKPGSVILIDGENMPKIVNQFLKHTVGFTIYMFVGEHHHSADVQYPTPVIKVLSPSTHKNGTDTCMQVHVGHFLSQQMFSHYFIVTRDNFGAALVDMIGAPNMPWVQQNARMITALNQL